MSHDVRQMADNCVSCQELKPANRRETLLQHEVGNVPWEKIGCDLFEISSRNYLIVIDYFSNFIEVDLMTATTSTQVVSSLKKMCARFGTPRQIVSDGGPQFTSREFEVFVKTWGIDHVTSSPNHQQANGKAESAVKLLKAMLEKCVKTGSDQYLALLELRNTPRQDTNASPAQMMF
ncbi:Gag-Pro-Pol polyprotein, partial [Lamellibrachia satsuma]